MEGGNPSLDVIYDAKNDGQFTTIKPITGKILNINTGGNLAITTPIALDSNSIGVVQFFANSGADPTNNKWIFTTATGGGGSGSDTPWAIPHNANAFELTKLLYASSNSLSPATDGFIRTHNDTIGISWRNATDTANLELKGDNQNNFQFTQGLNGTAVSLQLWAQHATDPQYFSLSQFGSSIGYTMFDIPTYAQMWANGVQVFDITSTGIKSYENLSMEGKLINNCESIEIVDSVDVTQCTIFGSAGTSSVKLDLPTSGKLIISELGTIIAQYTSTGITFSERLDMNTNNIINANELAFVTTGTSSATPQISASTSEMMFCMPTGDKFVFYNNNSATLSIADDGTIQWLVSDFHKIVPTTNDFQFVADDTTDLISLWNGSTRSNATLKIGDTSSSFLTTTTSTSPYHLDLIQNNDTPVIDRQLGEIRGVAENSAGDDFIYSQISFLTSDSITAGNESGRIKLQVAVIGSSPVTVIDIKAESGTPAVKLGFFNVTPVIRPTITGSRGGNVALASLLTSLAGLGLIIDSST